MYGPSKSDLILIGAMLIGLGAMLIGLGAMLIGLGAMLIGLGAMLIGLARRQNGWSVPGFAGVHRFTKPYAGRMLDGRTHDDFPEVKP